VGKRLDGDDEIRALWHDDAQVGLVRAEMKAARRRGVSPPRLALGVGPLRRAERQTVVLPAQPAMEIENRSAEPAACVDDARRLESVGYRQDPFVDDIGAGDRRIARREQAVNRERLVSAPLSDPTRRTLKPGQPVVILSNPPRQCIIPYMT